VDLIICVICVDWIKRCVTLASFQILMVLSMLFRRVVASKKTQ